MKNIILIILVLILFVSWNTFQKNDFVFQRGNQKMIIELENGQSYLRWNIKSKLIIKLENIDHEKLTFAGPGISWLRDENNKKAENENENGNGNIDINNDNDNDNDNDNKDKNENNIRIAHCKHENDIEKIDLNDHENNKNEVHLEIFVPKQDKEKGKLRYFISGKDSKDSTWIHHFSINFKNH